MTVETATYIGDLNDSYPASGDAKSEGDNHIRLLKTVLKAQFSSLGSAAVTATAAQLNTITLKAAKAGDTYTGTHDFSGATLTGGTATFTTQSSGNNSTNAATTAFVTTAVSAVTASGTAPAMSIETGTSVSLASGQHAVLTNASATTATLPTSPSAGNLVWVTVANGRVDNVIARNSHKINGVAENMTLNMAYATVQLRYVNATYGWAII